MQISWQTGLDSWEAECDARDSERCACGASRSHVPGTTRYCNRGHEMDTHEKNGDLMDDLLDAVAPQPARRLCKRDGCEQPEATQRGPYGRLCEAHAEESKADRDALRANGNGNGNGNGHDHSAIENAELHDLGGHDPAEEEAHELVRRARAIVFLETEMLELRARLVLEVNELRELLAHQYEEVQA